MARLERETPVRPSHSSPLRYPFGRRISGSCRNLFSPYSRAAATDFHRLPVRGVSGECLRRFRSRLAPLASAAISCRLSETPSRLRYLLPSDFAEYRPSLPIKNSRSSLLYFSPSPQLVGSHASPLFACTADIARDVLGQVLGSGARSIGEIGPRFRLLASRSYRVARSITLGLPVGRSSTSSGASNTSSSTSR
jgi:hypothetical protein